MSNRKDSDREQDEFLEAVWTCEETGRHAVDEVLNCAHGEPDPAVLDRLVQAEQVEVSDGQVHFTEAGRLAASFIIRRHRLAERLVVDLLGLSVDDAERFACEFEHSVVPEVTDSICTLLGHPQECPHGKPIPSGDDCREKLTEVRQVLYALSDVPCGGRYRVAYVRSHDHDRLHHLLSVGITPGVEIRVHQLTPVLVVQVDQSEFALDKGVAADIHVWSGGK